MLKIGLGYQALLAVILGIAAGLFFGSYCSVLESVGVAFVMLLQMVVLPYIPTLIIHGLGSLSPEMARKLFRRGWYFLLLLWVIVFGTIYALKVLIPTPLPDPSADLSQAAPLFTKNFLRYIIPQNPFYDLAHNIIPAIALFSLIVGVALMHLKNKEPLLSLLEKVNSTLERVFKWIAMVSPIGIFCHIAFAMGTVNLQELAKLELYVIAFILSSLFLSIYVFPIIVSCLSGISYKELMREYRIVCMLAFATGIPSIAFPFINNCMRRLAERKHLELATFRSTSQTLVPLAYSFSQTGNFFLLFFLFFISFFFRHPFTDLESLALPFLTIPISFGTPQLSLAGMSFLVDVLQFPREAFTLFVETMAITLNFQVLLSVSAMLSFVIVVILHYYGLLEVNWRRLSVQLSSITVLILAAVLIGKQFITINDNYRDLYYKLRITDIIGHLPKVEIFTKRPSIPGIPSEETLSRVLNTNTLRVGYDVTNIPFCYLNEWNEVVGYDIAFAYQLAKDLDVKLELIPLNYDTLIEDLNTGYLDTAMSAILIDEQRLLDMDFCHPYIEQANALVVPVSRVEEFRSLPKVLNNRRLVIGAGGGYRLVVDRHFQPGQLAQIHSMEPLIKGQVDAIMWAQLPAYVWCLANAEFTTLSYNQELGIKYFSYPFKSHSPDIITFVNQWLNLKRQSGFTEAQTNYWIKGKPIPSKEPRWSIIRNVLHWVD